MKIELTEQQEQAVRQGHPVEIVDPASNRTFVVVARDQYERVRRFEEGGPGPLATATSSPPVAPALCAEPLRQRVRDLPLPAEVAAAAKRYCKALSLWWAKDRLEVEDQMKLQHYYGGRWIAYLRTKEGPVVVAAAEHLGDATFNQQLSFLTVEERREALIDSPTKLFDEESQILALYSDESQAETGSTV